MVGVELEKEIWFKLRVCVCVLKPLMRMKTPRGKMQRGARSGGEGATASTVMRAARS